MVEHESLKSITEEAREGPESLLASMEIEDLKHDEEANEMPEECQPCPALTIQGSHVQLHVQLKNI